METAASEEMGTATRGGLEADYVGLIGAAEAMGCTVVFEWVGRQARIKVKERDTRLVLLQVRYKTSGNYMGYKERAGMAASYGVVCVQRRMDCEGKSYIQVLNQVREEGARNSEGLVLRLAGGVMVKVKTSWWLDAQQYRYKRWASEEHRQVEVERKQKMQRMLNVQGVRAVVKGLPGSLSPAVLCEVAGVLKVECYIARVSRTTT